MDNIQIYDSRLPKRDFSKVLAFLDRKSKSLSADRSTLGSVEGNDLEEKSPRMLPNFGFVF